MKIGDYIRTDDGLIGKIVSEPYEYKDSIGCDIDFGNNDIYNEYEMYQSIIKSSPNIIDLIEIGDYVNGNPVCLIKEDEHNRKWIYTDSNYKCGYLEEDIATILTHEQFNSMEYKIGE